MAAGTWTAQNKVRPGVYINFSSTGGQPAAPGARGVLAGCRPLSWGPVGKIMRIDAGADLTPYIGYDVTAPQAQFLREALKGTDVSGGPTKILLYRPEAAGSAAASAALAEGLTAVAKYPGARGNDISVSAAENTDGSFTVTVYVDGVQAVRQQAADASDLAGNDWVTFSGEGALAACAGVKLSGGADGTVGAAAYAAFLEALEPYSFDVLIYDGTDSAVNQAFISFVQRLAAQEGRYVQLVTTGKANSRFVIHNRSGVVLADGTALTPQETAWWLAGAQAGAQYYQSLTYAVYPGAADTSPRLTNSQIEDAIRAGELVLAEEFGSVRIETDINTLTTFTPEIGEAFRKNRTMRVCNTLANDVYREFSLHYLGKVNNNEAGRGLFKAAILDYLLAMYGRGALRQRPTADDVMVRMGDSTNSIVIELALYLADSVEKIYLTITVT